MIDFLLALKWKNLMMISPMSYIYSMRGSFKDPWLEYILSIGLKVHHNLEYENNMIITMKQS